MLEVCPALQYSSNNAPQQYEVREGATGLRSTCRMCIACRPRATRRYASAEMQCWCPAELLHTCGHNLYMVGTWDINM